MLRAWIYGGLVAQELAVVDSCVSTPGHTHTQIYIPLLRKMLLDARRI